MTDSQFYDEPSPIPMTFGPVFVATYESDCPSCLDPILPGEDIRADGHGSYIHADDQCERVARGERPYATGGVIRDPIDVTRLLTSGCVIEVFPREGH